MPGDRAQLGKAKTKQMPDPCCYTVFVKSGRQAHRVREAAAKQGLLQPGIGALQLSGQTCQGTTHQGPLASQGGLGQRRKGELTELLGVGAVIAAQQRPHQPLIQGPCAGCGA